MSKDDTLKMTRADLYDWIRTHGCITNPLPPYKANVIEVENPKTGQKDWLNLPNNETPVRDFTVYRTCNTLGIPIPTCSTYMKQLHDSIENKYFRKE